MMEFTWGQIDAAVEDVNRHAWLELYVGEGAGDVTVVADSSAAINEFELRMAIQTSVWEGPTCLDATSMVNTLLDLQGERTDFGPRGARDEWQARYRISVQPRVESMV